MWRIIYPLLDRGNLLFGRPVGNCVMEKRLAGRDDRKPVCLVDARPVSIGLCVRRAKVDLSGCDVGVPAKMETGNYENCSRPWPQAPVFLIPEHIHRRDFDQAFFIWTKNRTAQNEAALRAEQHKNEITDLQDSAVIALVVVIITCGTYKIFRFVKRPISVAKTRDVRG
jgi:hypothetical protein